jgi:trehalose 6-phosphate synthase
LAQYDLVGLQAERDVSRLMEAFRSRDDAEVIDEHVVRFGPNRVFAESFPIGIDADAFVPWPKQRISRPCVWPMGSGW